jgi:hypothetical protein
MVTAGRDRLRVLALNPPVDSVPARLYCGSHHDLPSLSLNAKHLFQLGNLGLSCRGAATTTTARRAYQISM